MKVETRYYLSEEDHEIIFNMKEMLTDFYNNVEDPTAIRKLDDAITEFEYDYSDPQYKAAIWGEED